jgi:hypothetical protein
MNDEKRKLREEIKMAREGKLRGVLKNSRKRYDYSP